MKTINPETAVIVFDLDDTLYSEYEYKLSGIRAIVDTVAALYPDWDSDDLWRSIDPNGKDWLDKLCRHCGFNESEKQVLLWQYRLHRPTLTPYAPHDFLSELTAPFAARALITDGRSLTQRLKLEALGLYSLFDDILVSEACASEKPTANASAIYKTNMPARQTVSSTSATTFPKTSSRRTLWAGLP